LISAAISIPFKIRDVLFILIPWYRAPATPTGRPRFGAAAFVSETGNAPYDHQPSAYASASRPPVARMPGVPSTSRTRRSVRPLYRLQPPLSHRRWHPHPASRPRVLIWNLLRFIFALIGCCDHETSDKQPAFYGVTRK
jgi:hypothetical protein